MHRDFAEWYRQAAIEPEDGKLNRRWAGVEEWCDNADVASLLDTVRVYFGRPPKAADFFDSFSDCFRKHDAAFPQRNMAELQVLAGSCVANIVEGYPSDNDEGVVIALAVLSASLSYSSAIDKAGEILAVAQRQLVAVGVEVRKREVPDKAPEGSAILATMEKFNKAAVTDHATLKTALTPILKVLSEGVGKLQSALEITQANLARADEECNILWWLDGECSRDVRTPWKEIASRAIPVIAGKELADLTEILPGPNQAPALLHRIVSTGRIEEITVAEAVNALPIEWVKSSVSLSGDGGVSDLTPIWEAMNLRSRADGDDAWIGFYEKSMEVAASRKFSSVRIAIHAYMETLLINSLTKGE